MQVYKFGGASVKHADAVRNVLEIIKTNPSKKLVVVISAMGKTTNMLEELVNCYCYAPTETKKALNAIVDFHHPILWDLFPDKKHPVYVAVNELYFQIEDFLKIPYAGSYDKTYDQFIGYGELLSTTIVSHYLNSQNVLNTWLDARKLIITNTEYRQATVLWEETETNIQTACAENTIYLTQGFIGSDKGNNTTSLGREGSDYTGGIFAYCLDAESLTIWKDVPGMLNADPKYYPNAVKLDKISYHEAIELSYYGASVIHPKTIKPLQNKSIPLYIQSFMNPNEMGSVIQKSNACDGDIPSYIFVEDQILLSISPKDFSFVVENNLRTIFNLLSEEGMKVNLMQNSAISFSICVKNEPRKVQSFIQSLKKEYKVWYNEPVTLFTIRHYNEETIEQVIGEKTILLEQKTRQTARYVLAEKS